MNLMPNNKKTIITIIFSCLIMALLCLIGYQPFMQFLNNPTKLKETLNQYHIFGYFILIIIMALQVIFIFLPGEIIEVASGFCYGVIGGTLICLIGASLGTIVIYFLIKHFGVKFASKLIDLNKINELKIIKKNKNLEIIIFIIFFIPGTPKDLFTYLVPFTTIKLPTFLLITGIARIPSIITSTISGSALFNQNYQFTITIFIITGILSLVGLSYYHHYQKNL